MQIFLENYSKFFPPSLPFPFHFNPPPPIQNPPLSQNSSNIIYLKCYIESILISKKQQSFQSVHKNGSVLQTAFH